MRTILACLLIAAGACGSGQKKDSAIVEGSDQAPTCCCKTMPMVSEKDIVPNFTLEGRMECSGQQGTCEDTTRCDGQTAPKDSTGGASHDTGVPPPPVLGGSASDPAVP